jgi:hypothetical protein
VKRNGKMKKILDAILVIIWIIDILNISFNLCGVDIAIFLDKTIPLNTLFWILMWIFE